jgi:two-component SAPR family response regulator
MTALSLRGVHVLIVEDNYVVASALQYLIEGYDGAVAAIVPTVARALDVLGAERVDIAVLDINLQGNSVAPLAEHLQGRGIPFVFVTGYADPALLPEHLRGYPRFAKPVEAEQLVEAMLALLADK